MGWRVEALDHRVEKELAGLPTGVRAEFVRIVELIEAQGIAAMSMPHVKHLENKLWEIRMKAKEGIGRAIYITVKGELVVVLHAFTKKTMKTPAGALVVARKRAKEVK